tara:strand:- start:401 stop:1186 length:786 start_codon:yes stop_codon:yes gene_type:complete
MAPVPTQGLSMKKWALYKRAGKVNPDKQVEKLKCGHVFHAKCIKQWFLKIDSDSSGNCPMCRAKISFSNQRGLLNRSMYLKKIWKEEKENDIFNIQEPLGFQEEESSSETSSVASDTSYQTAMSDDSSAFGEESDSEEEPSGWGFRVVREFDTEDTDTETGEWDSDDDSEWDSDSDSEWDSDEEEGPFRRNFRTQNHMLDADFYEIYDLAYNTFKEVLVLPTAELSLQAKKTQGLCGKNHITKKGKLWLSKQGQDFGCACV